LNIKEEISLDAESVDNIGISLFGSPIEPITMVEENETEGKSKNSRINATLTVFL
jgi:hypothetical protein